MPIVYQYQPITGPIWREPVAEKLAWLPVANYQPRTLEYRRVPDFAAPPFEALYKPAGLQWMPSAQYPLRTLARPPARDLSVYPPQSVSYDPALLDWLFRSPATVRAPERPPARDLSLYPLQPPAAGYDPTDLAWMPRGAYLPRALARPIRGDVTEFWFVYDLVDWLPQGQPQPRGLPRLSLRDLSVYPLQPPAAAYDPSDLAWMPGGRYPRATVEVRKLGDFQQPPFAALYRPDGLQWLPSDRYMGRALPYTIQSRFVVDPTPIATPYDPALMMWLPMGVGQQTFIEHRILGDFSQPPFDTSTPPAPVVTDIPLGPWGPGPGDDSPARPVRSMFDASTPKRKAKKPLPEIEIPPPVAEAPLPAPPPEPEPGPFETPLAELVNLETRLALTAARVELAAKRKREADETDQVVALLAAWLMMDD